MRDRIRAEIAAIEPVVDTGHVLLVDHRNARLWLPTGGTSRPARISCRTPTERQSNPRAERSFWAQPRFEHVKIVGKPS